MVSAAMVQGVVSKPECEIGFSGVIELVKEFRDEVKEQESLHLWMNLELIKTLACYAPLLCGFSLFLLPCDQIVSPPEASKLAAKYTGEGFKTLKLKVGKNFKVDI
ncbi:uncharacterized protein LOC108832018 [Raphanus sativus]|uniref:Uncharacterized protein LOC108832018 n=1 Tax=Raphanus sativus TaxID=3726 RepID=A0A6J0LMK4_RAPSA|nr:uncharacterized protein LOC108832018 [Raphanus sativus]